MRLFLYRHGEVAYYFVPARIGAGTVQARFGRLGSIDLRFTPGRARGRRTAVAAAKAKAGSGDLQGRASSSAASTATPTSTAVGITATSRRILPRDCVGSGHSDGGLGPRRRAGPRTVAETGVLLEGVAGSRRSNRFFYFFTENRPAGVRVLFNAFLDEQREGMLIQRGVQRYAGSAAFDWNLGAGTASAEPPAPFTGRAFFRRGADGRSTLAWLAARLRSSAASRCGSPATAFDTRLGPAS